MPLPESRAAESDSAFRYCPHRQPGRVSELLCDPIPNCTPIGGGTFDLTTLVATQNQGRVISVQQMLDNWTSQGIIDDLFMRSEILCTPLVGGPCTTNSGSILQNVKDGWIPQADQPQNATFNDPASSSAGDPDLVTSSQISSHIELITEVDGGELISDADFGALPFRCDTASYLALTTAGSGCVFSKVVETLHYSTDDPANGEIARHILLAQTDPAATKPDDPNKSIPSLLNRTVSDDLRGRNGRLAIAACNDAFPGYASVGLECDEYPFNSTLQGAASAGTNFSVCAVDGNANSSAGGVLVQFYNQRRILGSNSRNDPFLVQIDGPGPGACASIQP